MKVYFKAEGPIRAALTTVAQTFGAEVTEILADADRMVCMSAQEAHSFLKQTEKPIDILAVDHVDTAEAFAQNYPGRVRVFSLLGQPSGFTELMNIWAGNP